MTPTVNLIPPPTPAQKTHFNRAQAFEDAIAYRRARLAAPCPHCATQRRCDDHATDLDLIATYRSAAAALAPPPRGR